MWCVRLCVPGPAGDLERIPKAGALLASLGVFEPHSVYFREETRNPIAETLPGEDEEQPLERSGERVLAGAEDVRDSGGHVL